ncbi:proton-conducting transporter transmembrane domain-containing protein [Pontibacter burrus]|uniref:Na+/H+ antiporter subunit D n=1 Tax=Pontibacter burrus TaxID=2704466 RepID=A0A6B3LZ64_9BACT|nr:proton-conducting transporter membrane subunit [Pontibacter burrus]NEM98741.1 Na+/H+ antiporter subunit D [Pontibacter burrus]
MLQLHHLLLLLPLLLPLYGAIFCLFSWNRVNLQMAIACVIQLAMVVASGALLYAVNHEGILVTQLGNWPAPFGITLVADLFSALMVVTASITGAAVVLFSLRGLDLPRQDYGYYPLILMLQMGVAGVCLTGDLFNLFVWFEVLLICCFVMITLGGTKPQLEGAIKYVTINILASGLLLTGIGVVYGITGSLNMAELAMLVRMPSINKSLFLMASTFFIVSLGIKAALFPLFFWLPASYHTPPIAISSFIGGLLTKVGIYAMIRLFTLIFVVEQELILAFFTITAGFTMVIGVLGAAAHYDFRKILSFHIVSQIGYMLMGLAIFTTLSIAGTILFIVHNVFVKTNLFLVSGVVGRLKGSFDLKKLGSQYLQRPFLALLFLISALALAGLPPLSGFWPKFILVKAGLEAEQYTIVGVSLCVSIITLFSMTKIWNEVFWKKQPETDETEPDADRLTKALLYAPIIFLALCILYIGLNAEAAIGLAYRAAEQVLNTDLYINAVLNR